MTNVIELKEYSLYPGLRYERLGADSGERFRDEVLIPKLGQNSEVTVVLDGVLSAPGSSFLEEAFGGLVRKGVPAEVVRAIKLVSVDDPALIDEIKEYVEDAISCINPR